MTELAPDPLEDATQLAIITVTEHAVLRHHRARCAQCGKRRILFNLRVRLPGPGVVLNETKRLCAECAGLR